MRQTRRLSARLAENHEVRTADADKSAAVGLEVTANIALAMIKGDVIKRPSQQKGRKKNSKQELVDIFTKQSSVVTTESPSKIIDTTSGVQISNEIDERGQFISPQCVGSSAYQISKRSSMTIKRINRTTMEVDMSRSIFCNLKPEIITKIFFSGYFSSQYIAKRFMCISKDFRKFAIEHMRYFDLRCCSYFSNEKFERFSSLISHTLKNVVHLDMSFAFVTDQMVSVISCNMKSIQGLSVRGTNVSNTGLISIGRMKDMKYLDISKSTRLQSKMITNVGVLHLKNLTELELINLSWTGITMHPFLTAVIKSWKNLKYLAVQCCSDLGDPFLDSIANMCVTSLDISGTKITDKGFANWRKKGYNHI